MVGNILAVGLMSLGMGIQGVKDEPQMYIQDEATYTITYENTEDLTSRLQAIADKIYEEGYSSNTNKLQVTGTIKSKNNSNVETTVNLYNVYAVEISDHKTLTLDMETYGSGMNINTDGKFYYQGSARTITEMTVTSQTYYEAVAEVPVMGEQIIPAIASGLGLIGALATEFLSGFVALFYVQGALTPFAIFSLVMLGVAVSFAVVKLVLSLIKSNTGA